MSKLWGIHICLFFCILNMLIFGCFVFFTQKTHFNKLQYVISRIMLMKGELGYHFPLRTCRWTKKNRQKDRKYLQCVYEQIASSSASFLQMALKRAQRKPMIYLEGPGVFCPVAEGSYAPLLWSTEQSNECINGQRLEIWKAVLLNWGFIKDHKKLFGP